MWLLTNNRYIFEQLKTNRKYDSHSQREHYRPWRGGTYVRRQATSTSIAHSHACHLSTLVPRARVITATLCAATTPTRLQKATPRGLNRLIVSVLDGFHLFGTEQTAAVTVLRDTAQRRPSEAADDVRELVIDDISVTIAIVGIVTVALVELGVAHQLALVVEFEINREAVQGHAHKEPLCRVVIGVHIAIQTDGRRVIVISSLFLGMTEAVVEANGLVDQRICTDEAVGREDLHSVDGVSRGASGQRGGRGC